VVRRLIATTDHVVVNVDKETYAASHEALDGARGHARHVHVKADICDPEAMSAALAQWQPEVVMHLAAESHVDRIHRRPAEFIRTNVVGTQVLLEAARAYWSGPAGGREGAFRFHHISTDEVFGSLTSATTSPSTSTRPTTPRSPYSASKAPPTTWCGPGTTPTDSRASSPTPRTTTARGNSRRS
jgi:dTDP-glucose 4,6-dehydratase